MKEGADIVVVGAGAAGAVIASRATERSDREVLLLEAGPDYEDLANVPDDLRDGTRNALVSHDWGYRHRPTREQVVFPFPRGRVVGGSSAINTCIALRGEPHDYDEWAARGLADWTFEKCLPAFRRLETDLDFQNEWHGSDGPIPLRRHPKHELTRWQAAFLEACAELGFRECPDSNEPHATGYGPHAMNKISGMRMSAARCYLTSAVRARANLRIRSRSLVHRVRFEGRRVCGLDVERDGRIEFVHAKKVILSAGAIATPQILFRSGVGPREVRLLDHPGVALFIAPKSGVSHIRDPLIQTVLRYRSEHSPRDNDVALQAGSCVPFPRFTLPGVSIMCGVNKPHGFGRMLFESDHPHARPRIESHFLENEKDRAIAVEGMELAWLLATSKSMRDLVDVFVWPGERVLRDRKDIAKWIPFSCDSGYHPCGTVPMGSDDDRESLVDGRGRVRSVEGLIVADASIMPTIPSANTHLPTLMIGERFGEWVREGDF